MKIISHRGNLDGKEIENENTKFAIKRAISFGFDVEIDLWSTDKGLFLGHDLPQYEVKFGWLDKLKRHLWIHAKNKDAARLLSQTDLNWFWHENDVMTLTSKGYIWSNIGVYIQGAITVELDYKELPDYILGVCTDKPTKYLYGTRST